METKFSVIARISALLVLIGLLAFFILSFRHPEPEPWWVFLGLHLSAVLASVGLVELLFEVSVKKAFFEEVVATLLDLFSNDIRLAKNLHEETRKTLVGNTLRAQLGAEMGSAVYSGLVERYFEKTFVRRRFHHQTFFEDLPADLTLGTGADAVVLRANSYFRLSIDFHFRRAFVTANPVFAFSISDDIDELYGLFRTPECLFREQIDLQTADREKLGALMRTQGQDLRQLLAPILDVALELNGHPAHTEAVDTTPSGRSIRFAFKLPTNFVVGEDVDHHITLNTVICKDIRHYTVWLVEPSANPKLDFYHLSDAIAAPKALHFFTTKKPFDTKTQPDPRKRLISVAVDEYAAAADYQWVFPPSSVVFMWDIV